jgi:hypothetical protein
MQTRKELTVTGLVDWEAFCQRLGASLRAASMLKVLDSARLGRCELSQQGLDCAACVLTNEMTIAVLHRQRPKAEC